MAFYVRPPEGGAPKGPFAVEEVVDHIRRGWVGDNALVAKGGETQWVPISQVPEFAIALSQVAAGDPAPVAAAPRAKSNTGLKVVFGILGAAVLGLVFLFNQEPPEKSTSHFSAPTPNYVPKEIPPPAPTIADLVAEARDLDGVLSVLRPHMKDVQGSEVDAAGATLAVLARDKLTWGALRGMRDSSRAEIMKDPEAFRGEKLCSRGKIIEIQADRSVDPPVHSGGLMTASWDVVRFVAVHSTGNLVKDSAARICGIVTGIQSYTNVSGGTTHAVHVVGIFDLPENK